MTTLARLQLTAAHALRLNLSPEETRALLRLDDYAGIDSLTLIQFLTAVEREFALTLPPSHLRADILTNLPALAETIEAQLASC